LLIFFVVAIYSQSSDAEKFAEEDRKAMERVALKNETEEYAYTLKQSLDDTTVKQKYVIRFEFSGKME
jgi:hypothetical protein